MTQTNEEAADIYGSGGAFDPEVARAALAVQSGAGHYPWLDDPRRFTRTVETFLGGGRGGPTT